MNSKDEPPLLTLILLPFRLVSVLAELVTLLGLLVIGAGILVLLGTFVWLLLAGP